MQIFYVRKNIANKKFQIRKIPFEDIFKGNREIITADGFTEMSK